MKSSIKLLFKLAVLLAFLYITPFGNGLQSILAKSQDWMHTFVYHQKTIDQSISLKEQLNVLAYNSNLTIPKEDLKVETTADDPVVIPSIPEKKDTPSQQQKRIYIYNTHQSEGYDGGQTVLDAGAILAQKLEEKGFKVILETNDFIAYRDSQGMNYNQSYKVSYKYLNDALVNYGGFDLCIDLHRDSVPREATIIDFDGKTYAKAMMVVGGLGRNAKSASETSTTLTDIINSKKNGMMKAVMTREAYYNQEVHENVVLMEVGADTNTFDEIKNSLDVIAEGISDLLQNQ